MSFHPTVMLYTTVRYLLYTFPFRHQCSQCSASSGPQTDDLRTMYAKSLKHTNTRRILYQESYCYHQFRSNQQSSRMLVRLKSVPAIDRTTLSHSLDQLLPLLRRLLPGQLLLKFRLSQCLVPEILFSLIYYFSQVSSLRWQLSNCDFPPRG